MNEPRGENPSSDSDHPDTRSARPEFRKRREIKIHRAEDFLKIEFPPLKFIIPELLPEGAVILAGAPKVGKSRLALTLAMAVATGGLALGKIRVPQQEVLYLSLEDGERRTQARLKQALSDVPPALDLAFTWHTVGDGCVEEIEKWIKSHPRAGLVVVDVLERIRPLTTGNRPIYQVDYHVCAPLADLAQQYAIGILIIHHTRKETKDATSDPLQEISGSHGLTGAVDGVLILKHARHSNGGTLELIHRDLPDARFALSADDEKGTWLLSGEPPEPDEPPGDTRSLLTPEQQRYIDLLRERGPMRPKEVSEALDKSYEAVRQMLCTLARRGLLESKGGLYWVPEPTSESADGSQTPGTPSDEADAVNRPEFDGGSGYWELASRTGAGC